MPRGRPKGSVGRKRAQRDALKDAMEGQGYIDPGGVSAQPAPIVSRKNPGGRKYKPRKVADGGLFRRTSEELRAVREIGTLRLDIVSVECLNIHAKMRRVPATTLLSDILNCWLSVATDYGADAFRAFLPVGARAADAPERWAGYLRSLGFVAAPQDAVSATPADRGVTFAPLPQEVVAPQPPPQGVPDARELTPDTPAPQDVPIPVHPLPPVESPAQPGHGNAAQLYDLGYNPAARSADDVAREGEV